MSRQIAVAVAAGLFTLSAAASPSTAANREEPTWWRTPSTSAVQWRGMLATEGGAVGMGAQIGLYPVYGAAGLLVAIFTHAAINQVAQSAEARRAQEFADRVLDPYASSLRTWPAVSLWEAAAASVPFPGVRLWDGEAPTGRDPVVEAAPIFTLAQDEGVLILDAAVKLVASPGAAPVETVVRVVSTPLDTPDARAHWSSDEARQLKATAAGMLAHALDTALRHAASPADAPPMRTHRYLQGQVERTERAQLVAGDCARAVLRTLRGWLMSVPLKPQAGDECARAVPF
jgi:hypothetical protein